MVLPLVALANTAFLILFHTLPVHSQTYNYSPCPSIGSNVQYTDGNGVSYTVYCGYDGITGASNTVTSVASFEACLQLCDSSTYPSCVHVTYLSGACYLKNSYSGMRKAANSANTHSAAKCSAAGVPPYPAPILNAANASSGCGKALPAGLTAGGGSVSFNYEYPGGTTRNYLINIPPSYDPNKAAPLLFVFHGKGESAGGVEGRSGYSLPNWNPYGITVYPSGVNLTWSGDPDFLNNPVDDIGFINSLMDFFGSNFCIDTGRMFASGQSNGGGFTNVLACDPRMSRRFAAFGASSAAIYTNTTAANCPTTAPFTMLTNTLVQPICSPGRSNVPWFEIHGDADTQIAYFGGSHRGYCLPAEPHVVTDWSLRLNHTADNVTTSMASGNAIKYEFGGSDGVLGIVSHIRVRNWPHDWATVKNGAAIDATPQFMNFFYRWTNPGNTSIDYLSLPPLCGGTPGSSSSFTTSAATISTGTSARTLTISPVSTSPSSATYGSTTSGSVTSGTTRTVTSTFTTSTALACLAINATYYTDTSGAVYYFYCNADGVGTAVTIPANYQGILFCLSSCDARTDCLGVTYNSAGQGNCYLKIQGGQPLTGRSDAATYASRISGPTQSIAASSTSASSSSSSLSSPASSSSLSSSVSSSSLSLPASSSSLISPASSSSPEFTASSSSLTSSMSTPSQSSVLTSSQSSSSGSLFTSSPTTVLASLLTGSSSTYSATSSIGLSSSVSSTVSTTSQAASSSALRSPTVSSSTTALQVTSSSSIDSADSTTSSTVASFTSSRIDSSLTSSSKSSTSSAVPAISSPAYYCPINDQSTVIDNYGASYQIGCGNDTTSGGDAGHEVFGSFNDCFGVCDSTTGCQGFTYVGTGNSGNGAGRGFCYLKMGPSATLTFISGSENMVGGIRSSTVVTPITISSISASTTVNSPSTTIFQPSSTKLPTTSPSSSSTAGSSVISAFPQTTGPSCPQADRHSFIDIHGSTYNIYCSTDSSDQPADVEETTSGVTGCMAACDSYAGCVSFTFAARDNTLTSGFCYLRTVVGSSYSSSDLSAFVVLVSQGPAPSGASSSYQSSSIPTAPNSISTSSATSISSGSTRTTSLSLTTVFPTGTSQVCPAMNQTSITDTNGGVYNVYCSVDSRAPGGAGVLVTTGFGGCANLCDASSTCVAVVWVANNDMISGYCYLKSGSGETVSGSSLTAYAVQVTRGQPQSSTSSSLSSLSSLAPGSSSRPSSVLLTSSVQSSRESLSSTPSVTTTSRVVSTTSQAGVAITRASTTSSSAEVPLAPPIATLSPDEPAPSCTASPQQLCASQGSQQCAEESGDVYQIQCGAAYVGSIIDTTDIVVNEKRELQVKHKRATVPTYQGCLNLCSQYSTCVAVNYQGTNCTLFSEVTDSVPVSNNVAGILVTAAAVSSSSDTSTSISTTSRPAGPITITRFSTDITTVTSCSSDVADCPAGSTVVSTTLIPIGTSVISSAITSTTSSTRAPNGPITVTRFSTDITTVTSCSAGVASCPAGSTVVSTSLVPIGTSVISSSSVVTTTGPTTSAPPVGPITITRFSTDITTVISCSEGVTSCPAGSTVVSTSLVPIGSTVISNSAAPSTTGSASTPTSSSLQPTDRSTTSSSSLSALSTTESVTGISSSSVPSTTALTSSFAPSMETSSTSISSLSALSTTESASVVSSSPMPPTMASTSILSSSSMIQTSSSISVTSSSSAPSTTILTSMSSSSTLPPTTRSTSVASSAPDLSMSDSTSTTLPSGPVTVTRYSTDVHTVTSCSAGVRSCPADSTILSTSLVPIGSTVISGSDSVISMTTPATSTQPSSISATVTRFSTSIYTVVSCSDSVLSCPASSTIVSTTLVPIQSTVSQSSSSSGSITLPPGSSVTSAPSTLIPLSTGGSRSGTSDTAITITVRQSTCPARRTLTTTIFTTGTVTACPSVLVCG